MKPSIFITFDGFLYYTMELIHLNRLKPQFLEDDQVKGSEIWGQDACFAKGERIQVVAPSGSGKTSLIHFIYNLRADYTGSLEFDGRSQHLATPEEKSVTRRQHLSIIFQELRLFPEHTTLENIKIKNILEPYHAEEKIKEMAAALGVSSKLTQLAKTCSFGEQQRIAIIRALQQPFDFILMDEPFSHLDEVNRHKGMELIEAEAAARGAGIILADLKAIEYFNADRVLHL